MMHRVLGAAAMQSCSTWKSFLWQNAVQQFMGDDDYA
jgi:hypothetical protein